MIAITTARIAFELSIRLRGDHRSLSAPPSSMKAARGTAAVMSTVPSATPEPVSWSVNQARATKWKWSPTTEIVSPPKRSRKSRSRRGRSSAGPRSSMAGEASGSATRVIRR